MPGGSDATPLRASDDDDAAPPHAAAPPPGRTVTARAGRLRVTYREGTGNLAPPAALMRLLGALSDPARDAEAPQFTQAAGLGHVGLAGVLLGGMLGAHLMGLALCALHFRSAWAARWCLYAASLSAFHILEFVVTARYNPRTCTAASFLLTHSKAYAIAATASWAEFWLEAWLAPAWLKGAGGGSPFSLSWWTLAVGAVLVLGGQAVRTAGMVTCGSNFNHLVQTEHDGRQQLVTWGVYAYLRHPSYFGWFWWSVGTQMVLQNPVCLVAYCVLSWRFFQDRIPPEERALADMFGDETYDKFRKQTWVGIPFL